MDGGTKAPNSILYGLFQGFGMFSALNSPSESLLRVSCMFSPMGRWSWSWASLMSSIEPKTRRLTSSCVSSLRSSKIYLMIVYCRK